MSLGTGALVGMAGCTNPLATTRGATDIYFHNERTTNTNIELTVTTADEKKNVISTTIELEPNTNHKVNNEVLMGGNYDLQVTITGNSSDEEPYTEPYKWKNANQPLHVIINDQIVFAVQVG